MPKYFYRCELCEHELEIYHSIKDMLQNCTACKKDTLIRVPQLIFLKKEINETKKVGSIVNRHIEETKEDIKKQKQELANEKYKK